MAAPTPQPLIQADGLPAWMTRMNTYRSLIMPIAFVLLLAVILVPVPPMLLDLLITANISLAVLILLTTLNMSKPLEFSVFPSLLLATTLLRLVLNIASTRLILTADATSPEGVMTVAGKVIMAFGDFVAGGSLFVGVIIFLILMVVQFMVVTKGAGRVSEVAARFTLDAMPGKQMAIDSDLNAGLINEEEAKQRRADIAREADFYGAMDGASKFVKGDAIAGIIITAINILGGFAVGMLQKGWPAGDTATSFTILTIGDGLTSQIPSFVISIASALIVTQSGAKDDLGIELTGQLSAKPKGLVITSGFLMALAFTPLPTWPLLVTGAGLFSLGFALSRAERTKAQRTLESEAAAVTASAEPPPVEDLLKVDLLELEVGYGLVPLVDTVQGGDLLNRISAVRRQLAVEMGLVMPPVRIRDNMQLEPTTYRVKIKGNPVAQGRSVPGRLLAMDSGIATGPIQGEQTTEPAFGLDAWWIDPAMRPRAETMNYTVVDPTSVVATHLTELVKRHADELLSREEVNNLVEGVKQRSPKMVDEIIPGVAKIADLQRVLQNLLRERVPVRDMETIIETLGDWLPKTSDLDVATEYVRNALRRTICTQYAADEGAGRPRLVCVTLSPSFEARVESYIERGGAGTTVNMPARVSARLAGGVTDALERVVTSGHQPVVVASPQVRAVVWQMVSPHLPQVAVLGYNEVVADVDVESVALVDDPGEAPARETPRETEKTVAVA
ncbi:MAG: flagellar biosynthesis protein FlhA [Phycisphaeraceae bacterium]|nr:MAG: flagellar biosynthesis protein FlhA [Phycisphaeraceae bacterium]